jgi:hypothetical protein
MKMTIQLTPIRNGVLIGTGGTDAVRDRQGQILQPGTPPEITFAGSYEELCNELKVLFPASGGNITPIS